MQLTSRPWITVGIALVAAGGIAIPPMVTLHTEQRAVALTDLSQDLSDWQVILAGLIDPDLAGAPAQAADTAATTALTESGGLAALTAIGSEFGPKLTNLFDQAETDIAGNDYADAASLDHQVLSDLLVPEAQAADIAQTDTAQAVAALSPADPIDTFQADWQADWSQLVSGDIFSSTTLTDLVATLNAAPAAAQEFIAELIDPAATGEVTAYDDANTAAELATTIDQQLGNATSALDAATASGATDDEIAAGTEAAASDVSAAATAAPQAYADMLDAANALDSAYPTVTAADLWTDLGTAWSSLWADLGL